MPPVVIYVGASSSNAFSPLPHARHSSTNALYTSASSDGPVRNKPISSSILYRERIISTTRLFIIVTKPALISTPRALRNVTTAAHLTGNGSSRRRFGKHTSQRHQQPLSQLTKFHSAVPAAKSMFPYSSRQTTRLGRNQQRLVGSRCRALNRPCHHRKFCNKFCACRYITLAALSRLHHLISIGVTTVHPDSKSKTFCLKWPRITGT
jgi:hypothetical protein